MEVSKRGSNVKQETHLGDGFIVNRNQIRRLRVNLECLVKAKGSLNIVGSCDKMSDPTFSIKRFTYPLHLSLLLGQLLA